MSALNTQRMIQRKPKILAHAAVRGFRHSYTKPTTPRLKGKVERSHGTDEREF